jgi:hypothetical protein
VRAGLEGTCISAADRQAQTDADRARDVPKSLCGDWQQLPGTDMWAQMCRYSSSEGSGATVNWWNLGGDIVVVSQAQFRDNGTFQPVDSSCAAFSTGAGASDWCSTAGSRDRYQGYDAGFEYWNPVTERYEWYWVGTWPRGFPPKGPKDIW